MNQEVLVAQEPNVPGTQEFQADIHLMNAIQETLSLAIATQKPVELRYGGIQLTILPNDNSDFLLALYEGVIGGEFDEAAYRSTFQSKRSLA